MKRILSLVAIFAAVTIYGQKTLSKDYNFTTSQPYKEIDAKFKYYFSHDGIVISLKDDADDTYLQRFDATKPELVKEKKYENYFNENNVIEDIIELNNRLYVFHASWDGDNKKEQLFYTEIDMKSGEFIGKPKLLLAVNGKVTGTSFNGEANFDLKGKFIIHEAHDEKSFLVRYRRKPEVKRDTKSFDIIGLNAYDYDMNQLSAREVKMPYTERRMDFLDFHLDSQGSLYMLNKIFHDDSGDDKKRKRDEEANYHVELFLLKPGSDEIKISKFENKDKFFNEIAIFDLPNGTLIAGGYYSNGKGKNFEVNCDGLFTFKIKDDGTFFDENYHDIPLSLLNEFESGKTKRSNERKEKKGEGAKFQNLKLRNLEIKADGSMLMVGEQYFIVEHRSSGMNGGMRVYYTYHYYDILVSKIDGKGNLAWSKKIPKQQIGSRGRGGMSFQYFNNASDHFLVFLDNVKNIDLDVTKVPALHSDGRGGYLTAVRLSDVDGNYVKGSILNARDVDDFKLSEISMDRIVKTSDNSFVMEAYKKKREDVMIKVELK